MLRKTHHFTPWIAIFVLCSSLCSLPAIAESDTVPTSREEIVKYVRAMLAFPQNVQLHAEPADLPLTDFYGAVVTASRPGSTKSRTFNVALSKNREFLIVGNLYKANADFQKSAIPEVRDTLKIPATMDVSIGAPSPGLYAAFYRVPVVVSSGTRQLFTNIYLTSDRRTLAVGIIFPIRALPRANILNSISLANAASQGPTDAPITIVEFADLQCPSCARMHEFVENVLIPRYKNQIRIVFKEFPLVAIHDWARIAALASKCVYEIRPESFVRYRSLIFQEQSKITAANAKSALFAAGETVGVKDAALDACIEGAASGSLIEQDIREGKLLEISTTPTLIVNGRIVVGMPDQAYLFKVLDAVLKHNESETVLPSKPGCGAAEPGQPPAPCTIGPSTVAPK